MYADDTLSNEILIGGSMNDKIVIVTGGFDPIHSGHIAYISAARTYGRVMVGVNSDAWLARKKGSAFMPLEERKAIVQNLKDVMGVIEFNDDDGTAIDAINKVRALFPKNRIVFANGGDRTANNIPEMEAFKDDPSVEFVFGVGGIDKKNSSSWILRDWKSPTEARIWGDSITYYESPQCKVKRLVLEPGKSISMQYHDDRSEFWFVEEGIGQVSTFDGSVPVPLYRITKHKSFHVEAGQWHKLENIGEESLSIVEIQYGTRCDESDIVRLV